MLRLTRPHDIPRGQEAPSAQPMPIEIRVTHSDDGRFTAIFRRWSPRDSGADGACRRCPECSAYNDGCLMMVPGVVPRAEAATYSVVERGQVIIRSRGPRPR